MAESVPDERPEASLERRFPYIPWREPLTVSSPDVPLAFACRLCIALHGLKTDDVKGLPHRREDFLAHLNGIHGLKNGT